MQRNEGITMRECDPDNIALVAAIENGDFDKAQEILTHDNRQRYIHPVGVLQVTALHVAAWQGRIDLLNQLHRRGADVNDMDKIGRCALYYAAYCGHADVTKWLLQRGAVINVKVGVHSCTRKNPYSSLTKIHYIGKKLPLPVCWGRTPLHQAVKNNHAEVVQILVEGGANADARDDYKLTPLLLAGSAVNRDDPDEMTKFVKIIKALVSAKVSVNNVHPSTGTTALHHAAMLGSAEATKILLSNGAEPMYRCKSSGSTPLHIVANTGSTETLMVLLGAMPLDIDTPDQINRTALHIACYQGHRECVRALINRGANLAATTNTGVTAIDALISHIPRPLAFLTDILDSCVRTTNNFATIYDKYENITVDFKILAPKQQMQMAVITAIVATISDITQLAILQHPLVETFLRLKWARLRILFFALILTHLFFIISLSSCAIMSVQESVSYIAINRIILTISSCIILFHNIIQILLEPKHYLKQLETWLSFISATLSLVISVTSDFEESSEQETSGHVKPWVLRFISIAILVSWMQMMLLIGRVPMWGYYALMFSTVLKNILKVLLAFGYLIVGFSLSFAVMFHKKQQFSDFWKSVLKTVVMMMGEYEYGDLFDAKSEDYTLLPVTGQIIFLGFILLASIVLINLMIALAVNDIQSLEKEGHIRRLLKQAEFVAHLERVTSHRIFRSKWLHSRLRTLLQKKRDIPTKITLVTREKYYYVSQLVEPPPKIPADLMEALFSLVAKAAKKDKVANKNVEDGNKRLVSMLSNLEEQIRELKSESSHNWMNRKTTRV